MTVLVRIIFQGISICKVVDELINMVLKRDVLPNKKPFTKVSGFLFVLFIIQYSSFIIY